MSRFRTPLLPLIAAAALVAGDPACPVGGLPSGPLPDPFTHLDCDGDGVITQAEFLPPSRPADCGPGWAAPARGQAAAMTADTLPRLLDLVQRSAVWLAERGIAPPAQARREAEWIFAAALGLTRLDLYTRFDQPLEPGEVQRLRALVARRGRREPLAYILGNQPFCKLTVHVGPGVLVPRPETEELVTHALADLPPGGRVVDIGTGSGAIALAIAAERPDAIVTACDLSPEALAIAESNAQRLALRIDFHQGDLGHGLPGGWDLIVANLPYIAESERGECDPEVGHEPAMALFAGADGLDLIRPLIADLPRLLAPAGAAWLEHGYRQGPAIRQLAAAVGLVAATTRDHADHDRFCRVARR